MVLVLLAAAVVGWFAVRDRSAEEAQQAARACVEGEATLAVTAALSLWVSSRMTPQEQDAATGPRRDWEDD